MDVDAVAGGATRQGGCQPSKQVARGLDALNFFLADVQDGLGLDLAIYLIAVRCPSQGWNEATAGLIIVSAGYSAAFLVLAGIAAAGFCIYVFVMPETAPSKTG